MHDSDPLVKKAKQSADRLLKIRLRSEFELREKLKEKLFSPAVIEETIAALKQVRLVDDRTFARCWISSRLKKPFGFHRIQQELRKKGVDPGLIQELIAEQSRDTDLEKIIADLARRQVRKYKGIDPEKIRRRIYGYLNRRGFPAELIIKTVKKLELEP